MKKNLFMIVLLSLIFLWIGNISFAVNCSTAETCAATDTNCLALQQNLCVNTCYGTRNGTSCSIPATSSDCLSTCIQQGKTESVCNQECASVVTTNEGTPCEPTSLSSLKWDTNAVAVVPGVSCKCKTLYWEYVDPSNWSVSCQLCSRSDVCCGVKLNTNVPFIGNCIESSSQSPGSAINETTAFPILVSALVKILVSVILVVCFILIVVAGIMYATNNPKWGKDLIIKVAIGLAILGASGVILRLINPNFFG